MKVYMCVDQNNLNERFTPEIIACLDRAAAQADSGLVMTFDEYETQFQLKREAWIRDQANSQ